ncbi:hypothetical protein WJX81_001489 [Elliptochloris bilobata]|uniref:Dolichyl-diphosphooligosaccharide--protein glycosyltransferase 48 kDa subunit n=1 Tax=Elliptochloris bilobata TaxID=381761 RepID=A0AAW1QMH4_9CHLO
MEFRLADSKSLRLREWDDWLYDKLIIFAPSVAELGGAVDAAQVLEFVDSGRDLLLAVDSRASDEMRGLAMDCGVDLEPRNSAVLDHVDYARGLSGGHRVVATNNTVAAKSVLGDFDGQARILFRGTGLTVSPESELAAVVLRAPDTAVSGSAVKPLAEGAALAGADVGLVAIVQARNDARVVVAGSLDMFSNRFLQAAVDTAAHGLRAPRSGNAAFAAELTRWAFHQRGVLRASALRHRHAGAPAGSPQPSWYRITDVLAVELDIHELVNGAWEPYTGSDVQLEFVMLDPYVRTTLKHNGKGTFSTRFKAPDVYGVFKLRVAHRRLGYTPIEIEEQVPVRPFRHNEFERFLTAAYPYYAAAASTMAAFFMLTLAFLHHK